MHTAQTLRGALAVTALATIMAAPAQAGIVAYTGPAIPITQNIDGLYLNVITGVSANAAVSGWDINIYSNSTITPTLAFWSPTGGGYVGSGVEVTPLAFGTSIGPGSSFLSTPNIGGGYLASAFTGTTALFGFRFVAEGTGATHYGWARLSAGAGGGFPASVLAYAYENVANTAIQAGVVPEPGTYALMLAGLAGIAGFAARRRKAA